MRSFHACALSIAAILGLGCVDTSGLASSDDLDGGADSSVVTESGVDSEFLPDTNVEDGELPDTSAPPDTNVPDTNVPDTNVPDTMMPETCGLTVCSGACVNLNTDFNNCGKCGTKCADSVKFSVACTAGACTCASGEMKCGADCTVIREDSTACSACGGSACAKDKYCSAGACICRPGLTLCGSVCVDLAGDINHCGMCGNACGGGQQCSSGTCGTKMACPTGRTICEGGGKVSCFDLTTDATHCGACGTVCNTDELCIAGACKKYAPAAGCSTCGGCATCTTLFGSGGRCCPPLTGHTVPSCVDGPACP